MADKFSGYINGGFDGPKGIVSNFRHAERIFVDNFYRLSPRTKFLYYVVLSGVSQEVSFLVKTVDLPKFTFDTATKNVYNRTKHVYKKIQYDPINMVFHDDNQGLAHSMFNSYYASFVSDGGNTQANHPMNVVNYSGNYGMGFSTPEQFFKKISIYTLSRHKFNGYELLAPRVKSWTHGALDASASEPAENNMTIEYEGVRYSTGSVSYGKPEGFATLAYDYESSPLKVGADQGGNDFGKDQIFDNPTDKDLLKRPGGFFNEAISTNNYYNNDNRGATPNFAGIVGEFKNPARLGDDANVVGGVLGASFPKVGNSSDSLDVTIAKTRSLQSVTNNSSFENDETGDFSSPDTFEPYDTPDSFSVGEEDATNFDPPAVVADPTFDEIIAAQDADLGP